MRVDRRLVRERVGHDLRRREERQQRLRQRQLGELGRGVPADAVHHVARARAVLGEREEEGRRRQRVPPRLVVLLHAGRLVDLVEALGQVEGRVLEHEVLDHELVEADLEVLEVRLLERLALHLLREDVGAHAVALGQHEAHLVQDVVDLLALAQRAVGLDVDVLEDVGRGGDVAPGLLELRQHARELGALALAVHLAVRDVAEGLQQLLAQLVARELRGLGRQQAQALLDDALDGDLGLRPPLRQQRAELHELLPGLALAAHFDEGHAHALGGDGVVGHAALLLALQQRLDDGRVVEVAAGLERRARLGDALLGEGRLVDLLLVADGHGGWFYAWRLLVLCLGSARSSSGPAGL
mmetsp:Transcript_4998/g.14812  ORF Transcript_4998/g.14812 Transcript_4998/m.14812 type:complete len:355 (-) Transcript_4998:132-1196(-)